jgi:hypothetical protein
MLQAYLHVLHMSTRSRLLVKTSPFLNSPSGVSVLITTPDATAFVLLSFSARGAVPSALTC